MLKAITKKGKIYYGWDFNQQEKEIFCPHCNAPLIFVDAILKIKHFRHHSLCLFESEPETIEHIAMKKAVYECLSNDEINCNLDIEHRIDNQIADCYCEHHNLKFVIECQCSPISKEELIRRISNWQGKGVYQIWIFGKKFMKKTSRGTYIQNAIRHWYNFFYFSQVFYEIFLFPSYRWIEGNDFGGGYYKKYKQIKEIKPKLFSVPIFKPYLAGSQKRIIIIEGIEDDTNTA